MPAAARHARRSQPRHTSGLDGRGGSSYIDKVVFRDRDTNADGGRDERRYYLQNWRNDVVALITTTGAWVERYRYDAYGRPESYSVADIAGSGGGGGGPNGLVTSTDSAAYSATGAVSWKNDLGSSGGSLVPDNVVNATDDLAAFNVYYAAGNNGGLGQISDTAIDNRKGLAGYEFDPILAGTGAITGDGVPLYHVRNRVLNSYSGKWMQKDPLGYHDSMDLYEYCGSDSIGTADPLGLCAGCRPLSQPVAATSRSSKRCTIANMRTVVVPIQLCNFSPFDPPVTSTDYVSCSGASCKMWVFCETCSVTNTYFDMVCTDGTTHTVLGTQSQPFACVVDQPLIGVGSLAREYPGDCCRCRMSWDRSLAAPCFEYSAFTTIFARAIEILSTVPTRQAIPPNMRVPAEVPYSTPK